MKKNELKIIENDLSSFLVKDVIQKEEINIDSYILNYRFFLKKYLSMGDPSNDTINSYISFIDRYIKWCFVNNVHPLKITEYEFTYYRDFLIKNNMKSASIKVHLNSIKQFYNIAQRLKIIDENPAKKVGIKKRDTQDLNSLKFLKVEELNLLFEAIPNFSLENHHYLRDRIMIMLMSLEGLRTVEVHRMSVSDIDFENGTIYVKGKGHNDFIYPRADVLELLRAYLDMRPMSLDQIDKMGQPVFISNSKNNNGKRLDRRGIRYIVDKYLKKVNLKKKGMSCHMLRHTCGTLIYEKTKDLQIVKEVLRHSDVNITSKYAHIYNNLNNRHTSQIDITINKKGNKNG